MTQDDVLRLAVEAGIKFGPLPRDLWASVWLEQLERFANLVAQEVRPAVSSSNSSSFLYERPYDQLTPVERTTVDSAFNQLASFIRISCDVSPKMDDRAEHLCDAIATYIIQSRS